MHKHLSALLLVLVLSLPAWCGPRESIQTQYRRSHKALELHFVDGVYSIRHDQFRLLTPERREVDLAVERKRLETLLRDNVSLRETSQILEFQLNGGQAVCKVSYTTSVRRHDDSVFFFKTHCRDVWVLQGNTWLLKESVILEQKSGLGEPK